VQLFGTKGQKFLHCPGTKGQRDKLKILPQDGTGRDFLQAVLSRDVPGHNHFQFCTLNALFFLMISCFETSFPVFERSLPVLEHPFPVLERPFLVLERPFLVLEPLFLVLWVF
jgi:hypothetical protein